MRVKIELTVNIDIDAWTSNYGVEGVSAIRIDVTSYVDSLVIEHLKEMGVIETSNL